ncbi:MULTISPECIES: hypothetical protein [unclassified Campylobacter]|uniref:hypothetical protein n=1 Tax=unclassified Campylobacter TaxID=2593542 RepID=UPI00224B51C2|nr:MULTISPECIES: hypothetical protein [unclassified Campylobacter]MCX2683387.1 hypothetical protein [Campylobacter sp. MIT 21-1684]MCX2751686.1 hypothetical protein [Campylobacter sp. MIT 21-1682]
MTQEEFKNKLIGINPALDCLKFLYHRVLRDDYRGTHKLQHYRWSAEYIKIVLKHLPKNNLLLHTQGDIYDDYIYSNEEQKFCEYLNRINKDLLSLNASITDMGMRKIIFVNLQRMGFIDRFNKKKELCNINRKYQYKYVKITQRGLDFINSKDIFEEQRHLGIALDFVFDGVVQDVLDILNTLEPQYISVSEMMFFITYLGKEYQGSILTKDKIVEFINEFRSLKARAKVVEDVVSEFCLPENFVGNKTDKRDFHNWKNETQSMFNSFDLMSLFEYDTAKQRLLLKASINGENITFKRSNLIKSEYFKQHEVQKDVRFELHHIVPFYYAKDIDALKAIDNWQNLIYIDANSHKIFSLDKSAKKAIRLNFKDLDAVLDNLIGDEIVLKYMDNIKYKAELQQRLVRYNQNLLGIKQTKMIH